MEFRKGRARERRTLFKGFPLSLLASKISFILLLAVLATGLAGCAGGKHLAPALPGTHIVPETLIDDAGAPLAPRAFAATFRDAAYFLAGEEHPNACDHLAQAALIRRLVTAGLHPAIGLEMLPTDAQGSLEAFNAGKLAVEDLPGALSWRETWGYDFALYAPIFKAARDLHLPVYALNAPRGLARKVGRVGLEGLSPAERASLPGALLPPDPAQIEELRAIFNEHAAMREKMRKAHAAGKTNTKKSSVRDKFADFATVQSLWDTQMAQQALIVRAITGRPVVIIAGGGHVERDWGIARRLAAFDPKARVVTVMPWRGGELPDPALATAFYSCPAMRQSRLGMTLAHEEPAAGEKAAPLLVTDVASDSAAARAGLLPGDAVVAAGSHAATSLSVLHTAAMDALSAGQPLRLTVSRAGETLEIAIPLGLPQAAQK